MLSAMTMDAFDGLLRAGSVWFDGSRSRRIGMPEAIYAPSKGDAVLKEAICLSLSLEDPTIVTRVARDRVEWLMDLGPFVAYPGADEAEEYVTLVAKARPRQHPEDRVAILTAGSSDRWVGMEAAAVLYALGVGVRVIEDCGVSALKRTLIALEEASEASVLVVVAGFEGALPTVVGGLTDLPIIAVPTSVGYGAARNGETALFAMLTSCAQGVAVVGVDNGFGAGCAAARILAQLGRADAP